MTLITFSDNWVRFQLTWRMLLTAAVCWQEWICLVLFTLREVDPGRIVTGWKKNAQNFGCEIIRCAQATLSYHIILS